MSALPKVTSGNETKKFWSKVKQSSKGFSSSFGNLSLHSEHDGSTEKDTIIHKAMVNYYASKNMSYPEWLGVVEKNGQAAGPTLNQNNTPFHQSVHVQQHQLMQQQQQQQRRPETRPSQNYDNDRTASTSNVGRPNGNSKYSLSDIYNKAASATDLRLKAQQTQQIPRQQQQQQQQRFVHPSRNQTFNSRSVTDENREVGYGGPRANSTASNRLKERSMKQNKQSFETYANSSTPSFASTNNTSSSSRSNMWRRN